MPRPALLLSPSRRLIDERLTVFCPYSHKGSRVGVLNSFDCAMSRLLNHGRDALALKVVLHYGVS